MEWINILMARLRALWRRESVLQDIEEEMRIHVEMETERNIERGMPPDEARAAALKGFGDPGRNTELGYDVRGGGWLEDLWQDLRFGARMLMKRPGFTLIAVITLALGIGANTAIFSVVNAVFWQRLPYKDPERLVIVWETIPKTGLTQNTPAPFNYNAWREQSQVFENLAAWDIQLENLTGAGEPEQVPGQGVTASFFPLLGVEPMLGRWFLPEEDQQGNHRVVVLSYGLWQRRFGGDPDIVGRKIALGNVSHEVIGVMPPAFEEPLTAPAYIAQYWVPLAHTPEQARSKSRSLFVIGRLKPGVSYAQAQAEMTTLVARMQEQDQKLGNEFGVSVRPLGEERGRRVRQALLILLAAAGFVLLIACVNVANLLLARAAARWKETAIRTALGAGRSRLMRQFLTESLLLAGAASMAGLVLAVWGVRLLVSTKPQDLAYLKTVAVDWRVLSFTLGVSLVTGLACGLAPALQAFRPNLNEALKEGGKDSSGGGHNGLRSALVVAEVALTLVLLVGAGLMLRSFLRLNQVDMGFDPRHLLTLRIILPEAKYPKVEKKRAFYDQLLPRLAALPGVESIGAISGLPISFQGGGATFQIEGRADASRATPMTTYRIVSPDYFRTMKIGLVAGRVFTEQDREGGAPVAVIGESLARASWPGENPIGQRVRWGSSDGPLMTIIGIVKDVRLHQLRRAGPQLYMPYAQAPIDPYEIALRTKADPLMLASAVRQEVWAVDKDVPIANVRTMEQVLASSITRERFNVLLLAVFAALALLLALIGIYGVMSYTVTQSTRELGVRLALGAQTADVLKLVIGQGLVLILAGVAIGAVAALGLTRLLANLLYGVKATDLLTFIGVPVLLIAVASFACYWPARRAAKLDPLAALRHE
jgi:putative ABC transport system permease protein